MEDNRIIDLFFQRDTKAIENTSEKYGKLIFHIANNITSNSEDAEDL